MKAIGKFVCVMSVVVSALTTHWSMAAPPIQVTAANPSSTTQGAKVTNDACAQTGLDFPAFAFRKPAGNGREFFLADASGNCTRSIYLTSESVSPPVLSYPLAGSSNRGRIVWFENILTLAAIDFTVSGTAIAPDPKRTILAVSPNGGWGLEMSRDGRYIYTATEPNIVEKISVDNPFNRTVVRSFASGTRRTRVDGINGDESVLYLDERVYASDGAALRTELIRVDLLTLGASVLATKTDPNWFFMTAADPDSNRITYVDYLAGSNNCYLLQIANGATGQLFSNGQPRFGRYPTWHRGKIVVNGYKPPNRRNECQSMDMIVEVDADTSAQRDLTRGDSPNGS